ncbi:MAG: hypothetical protein K2W95_07705 [Candidatus Obscuribacterales bacterium]|nr:hypothetical protein [Candidatus Obscuribacterales bacterium]
MDRVSFSRQDNCTHVTQEHVASAVADFQTIAPVNSIESTKISQSMRSATGEIGLTATEGRLLAEKNSFADELIYSALRSTFQEPINGVAQLVDASVGTKSLDALKLMPAPDEHEFLSANWTAQQVGSILGMSVPFLLLHKGVGACSAKFLGPAARCSLTQSRRVASEAMVTAGLYDGLLKETAQSRLATEELADNRVKQALLGAATMGTLTRCSSTLSSLSRRQIGLGSRTLGNDLFSSTISGVPAGAVHAELESRLYGGTSARPEELAQSMISFTLLGGTFAAGKKLLSSKSPTYHHETKMTQTKTECIVATEIPETSFVTRPKPGIASCKPRQSETQAPEFADSRSAENNSLQSVLRIPDLRMEGMRKNHEVPREEVLDKVVELEVMFGIEIAPPDQSMRNPWKFWQGRPLAIPDKLVTRVPEWSEVIGLEAGLYRSAPSIERGLTYHFFAVPKVPGMAQEHFSGGLYERRQIFFQPNTSSLKALHEPAMRGSALACNMQALSTHENAHHGQFRCGLNDSKLLEPIARRLGWEKSVFNGMQTWIMKTADGQSYRFDRVGRQWIHVPDEIGIATDPARLSSAEFQRRLKVRPVTDYFDEPIEMITEGTTFFRLGGEHRAYLCRKSPELYDVVKDLDQFEINKLLKPKNQPLTRDLEGRVVPETVELKAQIQALESEWQSRAKRLSPSLCDK